MSMHESIITVTPHDQRRYMFENTDLNSLKFLGLFIAAKVNGRCLHHEHVLVEEVQHFKHLAIKVTLVYVFHTKQTHKQTKPNQKSHTNCVEDSQTNIFANKMRAMVS